MSIVSVNIIQQITKVELLLTVEVLIQVTELNVIVQC